MPKICVEFSLDGVSPRLMSLRTWIRILAVFAFACGLFCIPASLGAHPYYFTTAFAQLAHSGSLLQIGVVLLIVGAILFIASFIHDPDI
jgi:hypothetical protein